MEIAGGRSWGFCALLWVFVAMAFFLAIPEGCEAAAMPDYGGSNGDMRSAIKFLQDMDSYYGQIARPRYVISPVKFVKILHIFLINNVSIKGGRQSS